MVQGAFKNFVHTHKFEDVPEGTIMTDVFVYQSPLGILGKLADVLFLKNYMTRFLMKRNEVIKVYAEKIPK
jgi:ligand-binding SRPBCC domain-containing protein